MDAALVPLAAVALNGEGRRVAEQACADLDSLGHDQWTERYAWLAQDVSDDPSAAEILVAIGERHNTIGWVDWAGEDDEHQVQDMVTAACANLGLLQPAIPDDLTDQVLQQLSSTPQPGDYVPALLHAVDVHLSGKGLRLLLIDQDSDTYKFVPVAAESFTSLVGHTGDGYRLRAIDPNLD